ncbi:unnamed protein product [Phaeothamnion confervicola]
MGLTTRYLAFATFSSAALAFHFPLGFPRQQTRALSAPWARTAHAQSRHTGRCRLVRMMSAPPTEAEYDRFLGELVFSSSDVRDDVLRNFDRATDPDFLSWLGSKADSSSDIEERLALRSLKDVIEKVAEKVAEAAASVPIDVTSDDVDEDSDDATAAGAVPGAPSVRKSNAEITAEMRRLQGVGAGIAEAAAQAESDAAMGPFEGLPEKVRGSYEKMLQGLLERPMGQSLEDAVEANYERCDVQFLTLLRQKIAGLDGGAGAAAAAADLQAVVDCVNTAMQRRMASATARLSSILAAGDPARMEAAVGALAKKGNVDEALLLLLTANIQQAEAAGAAGPAQLLRRLQARAQRELDNKVEPEKRLVRQLLRTEDGAARETMLKDAFRPRAKLVLAGGKETSEEPEVTPPRFIAVVRNLLLNFGNANSADPSFGAKLDAIITEAEKVATELFGESQSAQDMQDRAWKDGTLSVWDLEKYENQAELAGQEAPWMNNKYDTMLPKNFNEKGEWNIGGS